MINSGSFPACLPNAYRYQFRGQYDTDFKSADGIVTNSYDGISTVATNAWFISDILVDSFSTATDIGFRSGYAIYLYAGIVGAEFYMRARITSMIIDETTGVCFYTFQAYEKVGQGQFTFWTIVPQAGGSNYTRNPNISGFELSSRARATTGTTEYIFPTGTTSELFETSSGPTFYAGYTLASYRGYARIYEDEYEINRPYEGKTIEGTATLEKTVTSTSINYDTDPPISTTTTNVSNSSVTKNYTIGSPIFNATNSDYFPGSPAVYSNGELVTYPTASYVAPDLTDTIIGTYRSYEYAETYQEYPEGSGSYRLVSNVVTYRVFTKTEWAQITPADFFVD
jgi:hypothetical protein